MEAGNTTKSKPAQAQYRVHSIELGGELPAERCN